MKWHALNHQQEKGQTHKSGCHNQRSMFSCLHCFLVYLHSTFLAVFFYLCVTLCWSFISTFYIFMYLITKELAKSSTVNVDSKNFNEEAEITKLFVPPESTWRMKVIRLYQTQDTLHVNITVISYKAGWSSGNLQYKGFLSITIGADIYTRMAATNLKETLTEYTD